jgi:hypothetical protein
VSNWKAGSGEDGHSPSNVFEDKAYRFRTESPEEAQRVAALLNEAEEMRDALRAALTEARCWIVDGTRRTPEQRGAKCETAIDARQMIDAALEQPAAQSKERGEKA